MHRLAVRLFAAVLLGLISVPLHAQITIGSMQPRGRTSFSSPGGRTFIDYHHPATGSGNINNVLVNWIFSPAAGCDNAFKVKVYRPAAGALGALTMIAERGPYRSTDGPNLVSIVPPIAVATGDLLGVSQVREASCGGLGVTASGTDTGVLSIDGDVANTTFSALTYLRGYEMSMMGTSETRVLQSIIPAVASAPGGFGSFFRTGLQLSNGTATSIAGRLVFHPQGRSGADSDPSLNFTIAPFATKSYTDIVAEMGQSGLGSIDVYTVTAPPYVAARVYNDAGPLGTSGFSEESFTPSQFLRPTETAVLAVPADLTNFRLNIGVRTLAATTILVTVIAPDGSTRVGGLTRNYGANYFEQVTSAIFLNNIAIQPSDTIHIRVDSGAAIFYAATTDNRTNDGSVRFTTRR